MRITLFAMSLCTYPSVLIDGLFLFKSVDMPAKYIILYEVIPNLGSSKR